MLYPGRSSQKGIKTHLPKPEEINMKINKENSEKEIKPEIYKCITDNECKFLNKRLVRRSKYKYKCNNGECVKERNDNKLTFNRREIVRIFEKKEFDDGDRIEDTSEFTKFNKFDKHRDLIFEFFENVNYLVKYDFIKYYNDYGLDDYFKRTLKLQKYTEDNLDGIKNIKLQDGIQRHLYKFNEELKRLKLKIKQEKKEKEEIKHITDMMEKSGIKLSEINITNKEFDNLSLKEKLKYLKKNHEIILSKINNNKKIEGFDLFKIHSLLNPKNGGKLKKRKEKLKKEKLKKVKGSMKKNNR